MAGTGFHPEGHIWKEYKETWKDYGTPFPLTDYKLICVNCSQLAVSEEDDNGECIDDY